MTKKETLENDIKHLTYMEEQYLEDCEMIRNDEDSSDAEYEYSQEMLGVYLRARVRAERELEKLNND